MTSAGEEGGKAQKNRKKNSKYITTIYTLAHDRTEPAHPSLSSEREKCVYTMYTDKELSKLLPLLL